MRYKGMPSYVAQFVVKGKLFKQLYAAQQAQIDILNGDIEDLINQCFVRTATWGLTIWEQEYDIVIDLTDTYENRRSRILAKMRGQGTTTVEMIKTVSSAFSHGEVEVIEHYEDYYFTIKFVGSIGIPPKLEDLKNAINEIKPAHLGVTYEFTYNTYDDVKNNKWTNDELKAYTYEGIRTSGDIKAKGV